MSKNGLRLAFAGTPDLAATILSGIIRSEIHEIAFVITRPDRPSGRGRKIAPGPVKKLASGNGLDIRQPQRADSIDPHGALARVDVLVVAAFGMILPAEILSRPRFGCINVHTSLLPRWRGAAPIQRAIQAGDSKTGISIMQIAEQLDTGDILLQKECRILPDDTAGTLHDRLAILGVDSLLEVLSKLAGGSITPLQQDDKLATYADKVSKDEARINWNTAAADLERQIRAFNPVPVAHTVLRGQAMRVWEADVINLNTQMYDPGTIIDCSRDGLVIATEKDALRIKRLQLPGRKIIDTAGFLNGHPLFLK